MKARHLPSEVLTSEELDREKVDALDDFVAHMSNEGELSPIANGAVCDGIARGEISSLVPSIIEKERTGAKLWEKWAELRSSYSIVDVMGEKRGRLDNDNF